MRRGLRADVAHDVTKVKSRDLLPPTPPDDLALEERPDGPADDRVLLATPNSGLSRPFSQWMTEGTDW
jgi:hypothetical protein